MKKAENYSSTILNDVLNDITKEEQEKINKKMDLAAKIAESLKDKGLKQKDLAKIMNKKTSEISKWLSGTYNFNINTLFDIEKAININLLNTETHLINLNFSKK